MSTFASGLVAYLMLQLVGSIFCLVGKKSEPTHVSFIRVVLLIAEVCLLVGVKVYL